VLLLFFWVPFIGSKFSLFFCNLITFNRFQDIVESETLLFIWKSPKLVSGYTWHEIFSYAQDGREVLSPRSDLAPATNTTTTETHGIEVATEFKPVDHPMEPLDNDQPIQCPLPEPSILNVRFLKKFQEKKKLVFFDSENCKDRSVCRKLHSIFYDHRTGDSGKRECRLLRWGDEVIWLLSKMGWMKNLMFLWRQFHRGLANAIPTVRSCLHLVRRNTTCLIY